MGQLAHVAHPQTCVSGGRGKPPGSESFRPIPATVSTYPKRPLSAVSVRAGFPSPADDHLEKRLDLAELFGIRSPEAVFFIRAEGDSKTEAGIHCGDTMVIDRSVEPGDGHVVVAEMAGEFVVKVLRKPGANSDAMAVTTARGLDLRERGRSLRSNSSSGGRSRGCQG